MARVRLCVHHRRRRTPLHPDWITRRFRRLVELSGLPPVRLHDLRHGAATLAHAAGADLKTVQEQLGHTSIVLTADTYTSVLLDQPTRPEPVRPKRSRKARRSRKGRTPTTPTRHPEIKAV